jgi:iron(III) transport system substrate-binding protein
MALKLMLGLALAGGLMACSRAATEGEAADGARPAGDPAVLNVYSARHYDSDKAMYKRFEEISGMRVRFRESGAPELLEAMKAEGAASPADVILASDAGTFFKFQQAGLTQAVTSAKLEAAIPPQLREPAGHWFGLARRARVIVYDPNVFQAGDVDQYTDLAHARFQKKLCIRSSTNIYNLSLMGEIIGRQGPETAAAWARSVAANFARPPQGGDTGQIEAIAAGECAAALVNHYYWVRLAEGTGSEKAVAAKTAIAYPDQDGTGTHVNVSAAAVAAHSANKAGAIAFIEWLATPEGQAMLVSETKEYPVVEGAALPAGLEKLPNFVASDFPLTELGPKQAEAQKLFDAAGWD